MQKLMMARNPAQHMAQLDGLRAGAVAAVAWFHWAPQLTFGFDLGAMGVNLFFVLSGFLITGILLDARQQSVETSQRWYMLRQFYVRRFLRIFPLFYATVLLLAVFNIRPVRATFLWHVSYLSNVYFFQFGSWQREFASISHFWSLAVEEQFYLVWPFLILFLPRRWIPKAMVAAIIAAPCYRLAMGICFPQNALAPVLPVGCLDALGVGALLAYARRVPGVEFFRTTSRSLLFAGLPAYLAFEVLARVAPDARPFVTLRQTSYILVFGWLTARASSGFRGLPGNILSLPPIMYIGRISYGLYILHNLAIYGIVFAVRTLHAPSVLLTQPAVQISAKLVLTVGAAALSWRFFEKPLNDLKRFFPYRQPAAALDVAQDALPRR